MLARFLLICLFSTNLCVLLSGQFHYGIKGSLGLSFNKAELNRYDDKDDFLVYELRYLDQDILPTIALSAFYKQGWVYFQSDIGYGRVKTNFRGNNYFDLNQITSDIKSKTTHSIDVPVLAGLSINQFKLGVGPIFSFLLSENAVIPDIAEFEERRSSIENGFLFQAGIIINKLHIELSYDYRFNQIGDYLYFRGVNNKFDQSIQYIRMGVGVML